MSPPKSLQLSPTRGKPVHDKSKQFTQVRFAFQIDVGIRKITTNPQKALRRFSIWKKEMLIKEPCEGSKFLELSKHDILVNG